MPRQEPTDQRQSAVAVEDRPGFSLTVVAVLVVVVAGLYLGRDILIPFALAMALTFALVPFETRLRRWGLGRIPAVVIVVSLAFAAMGGFTLLIGSQLIQLADNLPGYQQNIKTKIRDMRSEGSQSGLVERLSKIVDELGSEVSQAASPPSRSDEQGEKEEAVPVRIEGQRTSPFEIFGEVSKPLVTPLANVGLVSLFMIFMMLGHSDLRDRLIRLLGGGNLHLTTEVLDDAGSRVSRYLLVQFGVNAMFGLLIGLGLHLVGMPNALLWGALATVLRFIPYLGPIVAAAFPLVLAVAVDPGWDMVLWTLALFLGVELITGNVVEPWLYGASTGVSSMAVIVGFIFWTTLWGVAGLFLSTPLTVCLAVMGRYIPQLRFLDVLLGTEPVLKPEEQFYQRMLAGNPEEGEDLAKPFLADHRLLVFYDEVMLPTLRLAERDRRRGALTRERRAILSDSFLAVISELEDYENPETQDTAYDSAESPWSGAPILCIAGRTSLDFVAAAILAQLLVRRGIPARALPAEAQTPEEIAKFGEGGVNAICLSYLSTTAAPHLRQASRRFRRHLPHAKLMVGLWSLQADEQGETGPSGAGTPDLVVRSFADAMDQIGADFATPITVASPPAQAPAEEEEERLAELRKLELLDTEPEEIFDERIVRLAQEFDAPIALLSLIDEERQVWKASFGLPDDLAVSREVPRTGSLCEPVVAERRTIVVDDALSEPRFAGDPFVRGHRVRFFAGAPLRTQSGHVIGAVCVMDTKVRSILERERAALQTAAEEIMAEIENRRPASTPASAFANGTA